MKKLFLVLFVAFFTGSIFASSIEEESTEEVEQLKFIPKTKKEKDFQDFWQEKRKGYKNQNAFLVEDPKRYPGGNKKILFEIFNEQTEEELTEMLNNLRLEKENNSKISNVIWESKGNFEDFFNDSEEEDDLSLNNNATKKEEKFFSQGYFSLSNQAKLFSPGLKENRKRNIKKKKTPQLKKTNSLQDINLTDSYYVLNDSGKRKRSQPEI